MSKNTKKEPCVEGEASANNELLCSLKARYEKDYAWRAAWNRLSNKRGPRLQTQQEYIERRAKRADRRIAMLIRKYDALGT